MGSDVSTLLLIGSRADAPDARGTGERGGAFQRGATGRTKVDVRQPEAVALLPRRDAGGDPAAGAAAGPLALLDRPASLAERASAGRRLPRDRGSPGGRHAPARRGDALIGRPRLTPARRRGPHCVRPVTPGRPPRRRRP